jgi:hypothetical protein
MWALEVCGPPGHSNELVHLNFTPALGFPYHAAIHIPPNEPTHPHQELEQPR